MTPEIENCLSRLLERPRDAEILNTLRQRLESEEHAEDLVSVLASNLERHRSSGNWEAVLGLIDLQLPLVPEAEQVDLLSLKGRLLEDELLDEEQALRVFERVLELQPDHEPTRETLDHIQLIRENWEKVAQKYVDEATAVADSDRQLSTSLYLSAAEVICRNSPRDERVESYLRRSLEVEPRNQRASAHLERLLRNQGRFDELAELYEQRADVAATREERVAAFLAAADLWADELDDLDEAATRFKRALSLDPSNPRALRHLVQTLTAQENWEALLRFYEEALRSRPRGAQELQILLQMGSIHAERLEQLEQAEEYYRRVRKIEPSNEEMLAFYRAYYRDRDEAGKILALLDSAQRAEREPERRVALAREMARVAEEEAGNLEKAIDIWKGIGRMEPDSDEPTAALKRLYRQTQPPKWNALRELIKDQVESLPEEDAEGKIALLMELVEIYGEHLKLDVMVIKTYNAILALRPDHEQALEALTSKYESMGRWNDLIGLLMRRKDALERPRDRIATLHRVASLWIDKFRNQSQAIKPLREILELEPTEPEAARRLQEIYRARRSWRELMELHRLQVQHMDPGPRRRELYAELARLAAEKLGDPREGIQVWNTVLAEEDDRDAEALEALTELYAREERWAALAEVLHRRVEAAGDDGERVVALLERLGEIYTSRIRAVDNAIETWSQLLSVDPDSAKARAVLRELYVQEKRWDDLERLFAERGQHSELAETLSAAADRAADDQLRVRLYTRVGEICRDRLSHPERAMKAFERVLAIDKDNRQAAEALVPIYRDSERWGRLLSSYEVLFAQAEDRDEKLQLIEEIQRLYETHLESRQLAFRWAAKAYVIDPDNARLRAEMERLAAESESWEELVKIYVERFNELTDDDLKAALLRHLAFLCREKVHRPEDAEVFYKDLLELQPDDVDALEALDQIYTASQRWDGLVDVYRRRAVLEEDPQARVEFLFRVAFIQEERLGDPVMAIQTLKEVLDVDPGSEKALRSLARLYEVRGEWFPLAQIYRKELEQIEEPGQRVETLCRLGEILQSRLEAAEEGINYLAEALELEPLHRGTVEALEVHLTGEAEQRRRVALLLQPFYERTESWERQVQVLEILLEDEQDHAVRVGLLRRLMTLQERRFDDLDAAFRAGTSVLALTPEDPEIRRELHRLAESLDRGDELAERLAEAADAARERGDDQELEVELRWELGQLLDEEIGRPEQAETHLRRILELRPDHREAFDTLERILRDGGAWPELRALLEQRKEMTPEAAARRDILLQISALDENVLEDIPAAIAAYEQILELEAGHPGATKALERHYADEERWEDLLGLLRGELDQVQTDAEVNQLKLAQATLLADRLDDHETATDLLEEVVALDPAVDGAVALLERLGERDELRRRVAEILQTVYDRREEWADLVRTLRVRRELARDDFEAVELLCRIAALQEERLDDAEAAFAAYREALELDPANAEIHEPIRRLTAQLESWEQAAESWRAAVDRVDEADVALRARMLLLLAQIHDEQLQAGEQARETYEELLRVDPGNPDSARPACAALARIYEQDGCWNELIDVLRRQLEWSEAQDERQALMLRIGQIQEDVLGETVGAVATYRSLLDEDPMCEQALDALERLYLHSERWTELVDVYKARVELAETPEERRSQWLRIAGIYEEELEDSDQAISSYLTVLDDHPDDLASIKSLSRIYRNTERWPDLLEMLERELSLTEEDHRRVPLLAEAATIEQRRLEDPGAAVGRYRRVLELEPGHREARQALEELLEQEEHRRAAAEILTPLYTADSDWEALVKVHELQAESEDPATRVRHLREVARLSEDGLDSPEGAFDALQRALPHAASEPDLLEIVDELSRVCGVLERWEDLERALDAMVADVMDAETAKAIHLTAAEISRDRLEDLERARDHYQQVLDAAPDHVAALEALDGIHEQLEAWDNLLEVVTRRAELAGDDEARRVLLARCAAINRDKLERPADAIASLEQVLEIAPADVEANRGLDQLYSDSERWFDLGELLERQLQREEAPDERAALLTRLGKLREAELDDHAGAVDAYREVLALDPSHEQVVAALERYLEDEELQAEAARVLEPFYVARQDWTKLIRIYQIRLESADDPARRLSLSTRIAQLYEEQLEDLEGAFTWYSRVYLEDPADAAIRDQILRLAGILDRWAEVAEVLARYLDDTFEVNETSRNAALILGGIYDERLFDVDRAVACYRRVLEHDRTHARAFEQLESLLTRAERWEELLELYRDTADAAEEPAQRRELLLKICRVWEEALDNLDEAIDAYRAVLDLDEADPDAISALDRLLSETGRWQDLCDLLNRQCERAEDPEEVVELKFRLGTIYELRLEDLPTAIDHYEEVLERHEFHEGAVSALERLILDRDQRFRIAQILEPIYKELDEWAKLVVIYDAQLDFIDAPERRGHLLREIARLHEERGGSLDLAFRALCRAYEEEFGDPELLEQIERLAAKLNNWAEVVQLLSAGVEGVYDNDLVARIHARIAVLQEERLGDQSAAVEAWHQVLAAREEHQTAIDNLVRLLATLDRHVDLIEILRRKAEIAGDEDEQKSTYYRIAEIYEVVLDEPERAVETYRQVLTVDESDGSALDALERLYEAAGEWMELIWIYRQKIELAQDAGDEEQRRRLQLAVAEVYDHKLGDGFEAITAYKVLLDEEPDRQELLDALDRLYSQEGLYSDLLEIVELKIDRAAGEERTALIFRAGSLLEQEIGDVEAAIRRYSDVLDADRQHAEAREALERIVKDESHREQVAEILERHYGAVGETRPLIDVLELRLELLADPVERKQLLARIAALHDEGLDDAEAAFEAYARALAEEPGDEGIHRELERIAASLDRMPRLLEVYEERLNEIYDMVLARTLHLKVARMAEELLQDDARAEEHYRAVLDNDGDDGETLAALDRVLQAREKWDDLVDVLERRIMAEARPRAQATLYLRLGQVQLERNDDLERAFGAFRDALERDPDSGDARDAMEKLVANETYRPQALDVLEPIYEKAGEFAKVVELLETRLSTVVDPVERTELLERIADVHGQQLDAPADALGALGRALAEDPANADLIDRAERLADELGRHDELVRLADEVLEGDVPAEAARILGLRCAAWYGEKLSDVDRAEACLKRVLEVDPECAEALEGLERIYRVRSDVEDLARVLAQRAEIELDAPRKRELLIEVARLWDDDLADAERAVAAWRAVLELEPADGAALEALARLHERQEAWEDLLDVLDRRAQGAEVDERRRLKHRAGAVIVEHLDDPGRAIEVYREVLDLDPADGEALDRLEQLYTEREEWSSLQEVLMWRLEQREGADRTPIYLQLAELCAERLDNVDEAVGFYHQILTVDPSSWQTYDRLERTLTEAERWYDLVDVLRKHAEALSAGGDVQGEVEQLVRAAGVWTDQLDNPDAAGEVLEEILQRDERNVVALAGLARIYERSEQWDRCREVLEQAAALDPGPGEAAELEFRMGRVAQARAEGGQEAQAHFERALELDPHHAGAARAVEERARERGDWARVAELLDQRIDRVETDGERLPLLLELGALYRDRLQQPDRGVEMLERARAVDPDNTDVLADLADSYYAADRLDDAEPLLERLIELTGNRRRKAMARYVHRLGAIAEKRGDMDTARERYDRAYKMDSTNGPTLVALGRIHMQQADWNSARRVYRSMLLQNLDESVGITKADVFFNLGKVHAALEEPAKARSMFERGLEVEPQHGGLKNALEDLSG